MLVVNGTSTVVCRAGETVTDTVASLGAGITIDKVDKMDKGPYIQNPLSFNAEAKIKAMKYKFHDAIINGDHAVDPQSFEGLKVRIANLASSQTVYAVNSTTQRSVALAR